MFGNTNSLVRKYLQTLEKVDKTTWNISQLAQLEKLNQLLEPHHGASSYLLLGCIAENRKYDLIMHAVDSFGLADMLKPLILLLKKHKNLMNVYSIINSLTKAVKKHLRIEDITIYSAHALPDKERAELEEWIKQERHAHTIRSRVIIKPELIAGFRIEGEGFMGDYSVHYKLHNLQYLCKKEGLMA